MSALKKQARHLSPNRQLPMFCQWLRQYCAPHTYTHTHTHSENELRRQSVFKLYNLESGPATKVALSSGEASKLYEQMQRVRWIEHALLRLYKQRALPNLRQMQIGQEAVTVGIRTAMRGQDTLIAAHRAHVWPSLMGVSIRTLLGELVDAATEDDGENATDGATCLHGPRFLGNICLASSGATLNFGVGVALSQQNSINGGVCLTVFSSNATKDASLLEIYKLAKQLQLPIIFIYENCVDTKKSTKANETQLWNFCQNNENIPALWVDGNEVLAVRNAIQYAIDHAQQNGPICIELHTRVSHAKRATNGLEFVRQINDPILTFAAQIKALQLMDDDGLERIELNVKQQVGGAVERVLADKLGIEMSMENNGKQQTDKEPCKTTKSIARRLNATAAVKRAPEALKARSIDG